MTELEQYLNAYFNVEEATMQELASFFKEEKIAKHDFHTKAGAQHSRLSFVKSGYFRIYRQEDQKEVTQWISSPGEFATDLSNMMFRQPARWNIQAMTDCECYSISSADYAAIGAKIPNWDVLEKLFLGKCFITIEDRVYSFLSMSAEERYHYFYHVRKDLFQSVPQQYLASMLGMTPETFSRIRKKAIS